MLRFSILLTLLYSLHPFALDAQTMRTDASVNPALVGFGTSLAVEDGRLFVGRTEEFAAFALPPGGPGTVHVFEGSGADWSEVATLFGDDVPAGSGFGQAIAVDGVTLLVGAPKFADARGAGFVFERTGGGWQLSARLEPAVSTGDSVGYAVALEGDVALLGAPGGSGAVYVFRRSGGAWQPAEILSQPSSSGGGSFGASLAMEAGMAAVGAPGPIPGLVVGPQPAPQPGRVHVYDGTGGAFSHDATLSASDARVRTLGTSLAFDGDVVLAGAPGSNVVARFRRNGPGAWEEEASVTPGASGVGSFGAAVAVTGDDLLVGAPGGVGAVRVFRRGANDSWSEAQDVTVQVSAMMPQFGVALAAEGSLAVIGTPGADFFEGTGFVMQRGASGTWRQVASVIDDASMVQPVTGGEVQCTDGLAGTFDCDQVDLVSYLPSRELGADRGIWISDVWGWTDPETGREIAIVGRIDGTAFVDLSDPTHPVYLGELLLTEGANANLWRDMKVYRNHAFIVADNAGRHGMQVFDLTQLRDVTSPPVTFEPTTTYFGIHSSHNIAINEQTGFAYTVGNSSGGETCGGHAHMVDIRDPANPVFAGCSGPESTGTHDLQCVTYHGPDEAYRGREICLYSASELLGVVDVTDKEAPELLSTATYPNLAYSHQGWLSDDHKYFYLNDELDEVSGGADRTRTLIFDLAELGDPVLVSEYFGETAATDHNLYVRGNYLYESNYVAGLRVLDISDPENPVEVGYFDTVGGSPNVPGFAGSWSNYPYFESGIVVVTSIREGLFVLRQRERPLVP